jgi:hypothetical protein
MSNVASLIDRYIAMWNETDAKRRRALIADIWTETASYRDPKLEADGPEGINAVVEKVQATYPALRFKLTSEVEAHHDQIRFTWEFGPEGGPAFVEGTDFAVVEGERLQAMTGFFDKINQPAPTPSH